MNVLQEGDPSFCPAGPTRYYAITPYPKPRMTRRDKWSRDPRPAVARYRAFCDEVRLHGVQLPECPFFVRFWLPLPVSWSARRRREAHGQPHTSKPDIDNLLKALLDAALASDAHIHDVHLSKCWGLAGQIDILPLRRVQCLRDSVAGARQ